MVSARLMYNYAFENQPYSISQSGNRISMEAEQLNQISNRLEDLAERSQALRGYL